LGEWKETEISYLKANRLTCALCGHPIARRFWAAGANGTELVFCSPRHERLYEEYWIPRYGRRAG
jgi:hypothetical protein